MNANGHGLRLLIKGDGFLIFTLNSTLFIGLRIDDLILEKSP